MEKDKIETGRVDGVEIFAVGTWNGEIYEEKDLDLMVEAFNETKDKLKPYLKLGHSQDQKLLASDELPAAGWVANLRKVGKKLVADFVGIPQKVYDLIIKKAYKRVSAEIYWNLPLDGKKYPYVLKAVALLGGATPAVSSLKDILGLYAAEIAAAAAFANEAEVKTYEYEEENPMEIEALKKQLADSDRLLKEREDAISKFTLEIEKQKKIIAELDGKIKEYETAKRHSEIDANLDKLVETKKIVPAQREELFTLLDKSEFLGETKKFKLGEKEMSASEVLLAFVEKGVSGLNTDERTEVEKPGIKPEPGVINADLDAKAKEYIEAKGKEGVKVSYKEALSAVSPRNPSEEE